MSQEPTDYDVYIKGARMFWGERTEYAFKDGITYVRITCCDANGRYLPVKAFDDVGNFMKGEHKWPYKDKIVGEA